MSTQACIVLCAAIIGFVALCIFAPQAAVIVAFVVVPLLCCIGD